MTLFVVLFGPGCLLAAIDQGAPGVVVGGVIDGAQLGVLLMMPGLIAGVVALIQAIVLVARLRSLLVKLLVRVMAALLLAVALPVGCGLLWLGAFSTVNSYRAIDVPGHSVVVRTLSWHHKSYSILEGDGFRYTSVITCGPALQGVDVYNPFAAGEYDVVSRGGRDVLRFPEYSGQPYSSAAILGQDRGEDISGLCASLLAGGRHVPPTF